MKSIYKLSFFSLIAFAVAGMFQSCSEDEDLMNGGQPLVEYVRITRPESADSLIVTAGQGSIVAIVGQNLQSAEQLWFNDRRAALVPTYVTGTSIITRVPSQIPVEVSNQLKIIFANGDSLLHDFEVDISDPVVKSMVSEYENAGEVATIRGDYFYKPVIVTFPGGVTGEVVAVEENLVQVIVPEGAEPGPITITSKFGESKSDLWFRDNRNIIAGFEETDFSGWWQGSQYIVASDPDIAPINGKFLRINDKKGAWDWLEFWVGNGGTILEATSNIPEEAFEKPKNYSFKFEINTLASLTGAEARLYMGNSSDFGAARIKENNYYVWKPNINTEGEWQTVVIPFESFLDANPDLRYNPDGYPVSFYFSSPMETTLNFGMDNLRVVPN